MSANGNPHPLRKPCRCGEQTSGVIRMVGGQNTVRCAACGAYAGFNAPKVETGEAVRSVTPERDPIKPSQRARILERDGFRCQFCGSDATTANLTIGHILSVADAHEFALTSEAYNDDENLVAECERCNLGHGERSLRARQLLGLLIRRWRNARAKGAA